MSDLTFIKSHTNILSNNADTCGTEYYMTAMSLFGLLCQHLSEIYTKVKSTNTIQIKNVSKIRFIILS